MYNKLFPPPTEAEKKQRNKTLSAIASIVSAIMIGLSILLFPLAVAGNWENDWPVIITMFIWELVWVTTLIKSIKFLIKK